MVYGETQNIEGVLSDNTGIIMERTTPYGYCLSVKHLFTEVTCLSVSTSTIAKEGAYCGGWQDPELSGLPVGHRNHHCRAYYAIWIWSQCRSSVDVDHLSRCQHRH